FIHRRLVDGSVLSTLVPDYDYLSPEYTSYLPRTFEHNTPPKQCEPDITEALPIVYGLVDPRSDLALVTLDRLCSLWNPNGYGGYARYQTPFDPHSPSAPPGPQTPMAAPPATTSLPILTRREPGHSQRRSWQPQRSRRSLAS